MHIDYKELVKNIYPDAEAVTLLASKTAPYKQLWQIVSPNTEIAYSGVVANEYTAWKRAWEWIEYTVASRLSE